MAKKTLQDVLKKQGSISNKFDQHTKKIARIFEQCHKKNLSNKDSGKRLSDGSEVTYFTAFQSVRKKIYNQFGIVDPMKIKKEHTNWLLKEEMANLSANHIRKTEQAIHFINSFACESGVYKKELDMIDHEDMLEYFKEEGIIRSSRHSSRYKADDNECEDVLEEIYDYCDGKNSEYGDIARVQYLTGGRGIETIGLKPSDIDLESNKVYFDDAKGGLNNVVWCSHWTENDKIFMKNLVENAKDDRLFRIKGKDGNYLSDEAIKIRVNNIAKRAANRIGVGKGTGKDFRSHSFRGGFGFKRTKIYCSLSSADIDKAIEQKIEEQPRLKQRFNNFKKHILDKVKEPNNREIQDYEKVQWLVSVDLNHSRQDVVRFYVPTDYIKDLLAKR